MQMAKKVTGSSWRERERERERDSMAEQREPLHMYHVSIIGLPIALEYNGSSTMVSANTHHITHESLSWLPC